MLFAKCRRRPESKLCLWGEEPPSGETPMTTALSTFGRMVLAHELGHTCFYASDHREGQPRRLVPSGPAGTPSYCREEGLCQTFAGALLMGGAVPDWATQPSMSCVLRMRYCYDVGAEVVLHRVLHEWKLWPDAVFASVGIEGVTRSIELFHGASKRYAKELTRTSVGKRLEGCHEPEEVVDALIHKLNVAPNQIAAGGRSVLAMLRQ